MQIRPQIVCISLAVGVFLAGCGAPSTDVDKKTNDDYHNHVAGPKPPAGAIHGGPPKGGAPGPASAAPGSN